MAEQLALLGGSKAVQTDVGDIFGWPIITQEAEDAALDVLRRGAMSGTDITQLFEAEYAAWQGTKYALAFSTGTAALQAAMYGCGVRRVTSITIVLFCTSLTTTPVRSLRLPRSLVSTVLITSTYLTVGLSQADLLFCFDSSNITASGFGCGCFFQLTGLRLNLQIKFFFHQVA